MRRSESGINCLLAIDKPLGLSSHDVVNRVRRILGERRVGHAGTLDPAASGVLVIGVGQAARLLGMLTLDDKRYDARIAFGAQTSTDDAEGEVVRTAEVPARLAEPAVAEVICASLMGPCDQMPPAYSAISVDGRRAYDRARKGEDVELPVRHVTIYEARLNGVERQDALVWDCSFHVSKGTYIRSIARDLGESLGTASHLCGLRRTASGPIGLSQCVTLEELEAAGPNGVGGLFLDPVMALQLPHHELNDYERDAVKVGRQFGCRMIVLPDGSMRPPVESDRVALVRDGRLMGVWEMRGSRLACVANFTDGIEGARP
ncbi:MAG: tRNA pseudouridine(55) synthase TruB [Atopobiaceae bacterium]|nr:tRNA pseudouridine(55) synthase TruB [Atopobiaceae bacterium]